MMLVINRYTNPNTNKVTICVHEMKGHKIVKSYSPMCESNIDLFKGRKAMIFNVAKSTDLNKVKIICV